jgi:hypothetical protein
VEDLLRVLPWVGGIYDSNAVAHKDATLDHRKDVCVIGCLDANARTRVLDSFRSWESPLQCFNDAPIRAATAANPFSLYPTKQESQFAKEARSIRGERLQSVRGAVVCHGELQHRRTEVCESIPAAVDPERSIS